MANSNEEWWALNGVSLQQYGWAVTTVGGARYDLPPRRGDNITLAYRTGQLHASKTVDQRTISLAMFMTGTDPATGADTGDAVRQWNDNWDFLRRLVWNTGDNEVPLTRRWRLTQNGTSSVLSATGLCAVTDTMAPTMTGRTRSTFTMDLVMADPFFYGTTVTTTLTPGVVTPIVNPGHDTAAYSRFTIDLVGPLTNPIIGNGSTNPNTWVKYAAVINPGITIRLDIGAFTCLRTSDGNNKIAGITHGGARPWMILAPGTNLLNLTASAGSGHAVVRFQPPYI